MRPRARISDRESECGARVPVLREPCPVVATLGCDSSGSGASQGAPAEQLLRSCSTPLKVSSECPEWALIKSVRDEFFRHGWATWILAFSDRNCSFPCLLSASATHRRGAHP